MSRVGAIVAMTRDRVIGLGGKLPWHYSEDLKRFRLRTLGSAVIMGRRTWESIGEKPLPHRRNIVITGAMIEGAEHYPSIGEALERCRDEPVWFIGGARIYEEAMNYCDLLDVTLVPDRIDDPGAVRFPEIDPATWLAEPARPLEGDPRLFNRVYHRREPQTRGTHDAQC